MDEKLENLIKYVSSDGRVCPAPMKWNELYDMLPNKEYNKPALPLILSAWWETGALWKKIRLKEHITFGFEQGLLDKIDVFLRSLGKDEWAYGNGTDNYEEYKNNPIWNKNKE
tara:strand:- start:28 stop:366 length:339 start_codon:yes stop_codon:yes gene_type:complete